MRRSSIAIAFVLFVAGAAGAHAADAKTKRPNIIVIMSDDMGYSDLGCYGGEIETPNLDRLAAGGVRFTQFYNTARCCPTRAALLTGLYSHQAGIGHMMEDRGLPGYRGDLNTHCVTIAEALRPAGYRSYAVGKWHVTPHVKPEGPKHNWPLQRGFDRYYGCIVGAVNFYDPSALVRDNTAITAFNDAEYKPDQYYFTHALSDHAVRYISDHRREHAEQPFFLYLAYTAAHWPMQALESDIAKYRGKYNAGYEAIRRARYERGKQLGTIDPNWELSETFGDWNEVENKEWEARCMEVYAAMVDSMDQGIGRIVATLRESGELDNTLICFLQDNGGCAENVGRKGKDTRKSQPSLDVIGADVISQAINPPQTRDGWPVLAGSGVMPGPRDTYIAYGEGWANVSNTPFRMYKHWEHEGGISSPLVVHWPSGIAAERRGKLEHQPSHLIDLMPTCLAAAGATYPTERAGSSLVELAGVSLRPAFNGQPLERTGPIFWEHEGNRAVRDGKWKLVSKHNQPWELYDIEADRSEQHDLSAKQPGRVNQMKLAYRLWTQEVGVAPWPIGSEAKPEDLPRKE
jgi:arylsulfatase